ncbi:MAG: hypothetical protein IKF78_04950 [Atopobiaceae bacterium]|nr:hypothetical protein [Atopobiaceae bacterium]
MQNFGWQKYVRDGAMSGTTGRGLRLEGIQIVLVAKGARCPARPTRASRSGTRAATSPDTGTSSGCAADVPASGCPK